MPDRTERVAADYARVATNNAPAPQTNQQARLTAKLELDVKRVIAAQDPQGRWVEEGRLRSHGSQNERVICSETFIRNVETLSRYLAATKP